MSTINGPKPPARVLPGPKAIGAVERVSFEDRLQHRLGRRLDYPVTNARNPQGAVAAISLGDGDPADRKRAVGDVSKLSPKVVEEGFDALFLDVGDGDAVDARGTRLALTSFQARSRKSLR